ncbi:hypothetical protein [Deinococcus sp.]|uniref:hypothetical protein n=1 Tax=Deinococcus sp. TaxID=47478 RepID=UPI0025FE9B3D|nr:hypothetical protein [Deinococcus sp.]
MMREIQFPEGPQSGGYGAVHGGTLEFLLTELRRLQARCAAQDRRLDQLEARTPTRWADQPPHVHFEIDP